MRYEIADIAPDGTVGPALTAAQLVMEANAPDFGDMSVTLPDGTVLVFKGMVELFALGAGLSAGDDQLIASLEDLIAPAAGPEGGAGPDGGGSSQAFNLASPGAANEFGDAPEGRFDPADTDIAPLADEEEDPGDAPDAPAFSDPGGSAPGGDPDPDTGDPEDSRILFTSNDDIANFNRGFSLFQGDGTPLNNGTPNPQFARLSESSGNVDPATRNVTRALAGDDQVVLDDKDGVNNLNKLFGAPTAFFGGAGDDTVSGGSDHDIVVGDDPLTGNDTFGDDSLTGNGGNDTLLGDAEDDLDGRDGGDDTLRGGDGDDLLVGDTGANRTADAGDDLQNGRDRRQRPAGGRRRQRPAVRRCLGTT